MIARIAPQLSDLVDRLDHMTLVPRRLRFQDLDGHRFEELLSRYLIATGWQQVEWSGEGGDDGGWDVAAVDDQGRATCFACTNHERIAFVKPQEDINKLRDSRRGLPERLVYVVGGKVSDDMRKRIKDYAAGKGIAEAEVWSGSDFEGRLKERAPALVQEFFAPVWRVDRRSELPSPERPSLPPPKG